MSTENVLSKAFGLPDSMDPNHSYAFRSNEFGKVYRYWYTDKAGNYWLYTNAPTDHEDHNKYDGPPIIDPSQPFPHSHPSFFSPLGKKRHMSVPKGMQAEINEDYDPTDEYNWWFEKYADTDGAERFIYLDADIKENIDLYLQHQLRVVDSGIKRMRSFAAKSFLKQYAKDRVVGLMIMLVDQAFFSVDELVNATVSDISFVDKTVKLLGRKLKCDDLIFDFLSSLVIDRDPDSPLFVLETYHGKTMVGLNMLYSVFFYLKVSPKFLFAWHVNHIYSRIYNRLALPKEPNKRIKEQALEELSRVFSSGEDIRVLIDRRLDKHLATAYEEMEKSLPQHSDDLGVHLIYSDLVDRSDSEKEFSEWLHNTPLHEPPEPLTAEEEEEI